MPYSTVLSIVSFVLWAFLAPPLCRLPASTRICKIVTVEPGNFTAQAMGWTHGSGSDTPPATFPSCPGIAPAGTDGSSQKRRLDPNHELHEQTMKILDIISGPPEMQHDLQKEFEWYEVLKERRSWLQGMEHTAQAAKPTAVVDDDDPGNDSTYRKDEAHVPMTEGVGTCPIDDSSFATVPGLFATSKPEITTVVEPNAWSDPDVATRDEGKFVRTVEDLGGMPVAGGHAESGLVTDTTVALGTKAKAGKSKHRVIPLVAAAEAVTPRRPRVTRIPVPPSFLSNSTTRDPRTERVGVRSRIHKRVEEAFEICWKLFKGMVLQRGELVEVEILHPDL